VDLLRPVRAFDRFQQRHGWLAIPMAVVKKFGDDQAGSLAALVAYYSFGPPPVWTTRLGCCS